MNQTITISQTKFDELLKRMNRLESMLKKLLARTTEERIPYVDEETERQIGLSLKDLAEGRYETIDPSDKKALKRMLD